MVCIKLYGGLGNQMFQYALARSLSYRLKTEIVVDSTFYKLNGRKNNTTLRSFELDIFKLPVREINKSELKKLKPLKFRVLNACCFKMKLNLLQFSTYFFENRIGYNDGIRKVKDNCYLSGYWQSHLYFNDIKDILVNDFQFPEILDQNVENLSNQILGSNSVSVHIRRGDFVKNGVSNSHVVCSLSYYIEAINYINSKFEDTRLFVFSDDVEWAKINLPFNAIYVSGNHGKNSYVDMQLMSLCKHNIIANSSFSWWAAWLNQNANKVIIAPKKWYNDESMNSQTEDLIPKSWIRV